MAPLTLLDRRVQAVKDLLLRHVEELEEDSTDFLENSLCIPRSWIAEAEVRSVTAIQLAFSDSTIYRLSTIVPMATCTVNTLPSWKRTCSIEHTVSWLTDWLRKQSCGKMLRC